MCLSPMIFRPSCPETSRSQSLRYQSITLGITMNNAHGSTRATFDLR